MIPNWHVRPGGPLCLPAGSLDTGQFTQSGPAADMPPDPLLATIIDTVAGPDGAGLAGLSDDQLIGLIAAVPGSNHAPPGAAIAVMQTSGYRYFLEQPTRPQTIGYALTDAPAAPAAWMLDHDTDAYCKISRAFLDGQPSDRLTWHSILDNITLYWLTGTGATAAMVRDYQVWHHPSDGLPGPSGSSTREDETVMIFLKQAPYN